MQSEQFIQSLETQTRQIIEQLTPLKNYDLAVLSWKSHATSWSILECIEHLNLYGDFYLPQIAQKIKASATRQEPVFKSSFLGNYFAKTMLPKEKLSKMKTFKDKNPLNAALDKSVLDKSIHQQMQLLELLTQSKKVSLSKIKISTSISKWIRLPLGDTFAFFINHMLRHLNQIDRIQVAMKAVANQ